MAAESVTSHPFRTFTVRLPFSKSISNRLLLLRAFSKGRVDIEGLSTSTDTVRLQSLLENNEKVIDAGDGGTTFRFLLPYLVMTGTDRVLSGSGRMHLRPVRELVDALRSIGADIRYMEAEGYPPLHILPSELHGGQVTVDTSRSSQFASALLLAAPFVKGGLSIRLSGSRVSESYIQMTLRLLTAAGIRWQHEGQQIRIPEQSPSETVFMVERDWSSAAFWYQLVCLRPELTVLLQGLRTGSLQGDEAVCHHFSRLGVATKLVEEGVLIANTASPEAFAPLVFDLVSTPDLAPALVLACFGRKIPAVFTGIGHLQYKESDRMQVLKKFVTLSGGVVYYDGDRFELKSFPEKITPPEVDPHHDHRIAMAFAVLASIAPGIRISDPDVVSKSYPEFWGELEACGFTGIAI